MNLPNKLTVSRLVLTPFFFFVFFLCDWVPSFPKVLYITILLLVYAAMELSDLLDGKIARKRGLVTDLGKVMDPFADVISHITVFTCLLCSGIMPVACYIFIIWREYSQSFMRMLLMGKGKPMAANIFGKAKTCLYAFCALLGIALRIIVVYDSSLSFIPEFFIVMKVLFALAAFSSVASFIIYMKGTIKSGILKDMTR